MACAYSKHMANANNTAATLQTACHAAIANLTVAEFAERQGVTVESIVLQTVATNLPQEGIPTAAPIPTGAPKAKSGKQGRPFTVEPQKVDKAVKNTLRAAKAPMRKQALIGRTHYSDSIIGRSLKRLMASGEVARVGTTKGARYKLA